MKKKYRKGPVRTMTHDECVYLAGLFDGEGTFMINAHAFKGQHKYSAKVRLALSHKPAVEWVAKAIGVNVAPHGLGRNNTKSRPMFRVAVENVEGIISLINQILPFLIVKREPAEVLLAFCRARLQSGYFTKSRTRSGYSPDEIALHGRLRDLNRVGVDALTHRKAG